MKRQDPFRRLNPGGWHTVTTLRPKGTFAVPRDRRGKSFHLYTDARALWHQQLGGFIPVAATKCGLVMRGVSFPMDAPADLEFCDNCVMADSGPLMYRFFDAQGQLLYIGSTINLYNRIIGHRCSPDSARWWGSVASLTFVEFPDLPAALSAEAVAIRTDRPPYNTKHAGRNAHDTPASTGTAA